MEFFFCLLGKFLQYLNEHLCTNILIHQVYQNINPILVIIILGKLIELSGSHILVFST